MPAGGLIAKPYRGPGFNLHKLGVLEGVAEPACNSSTQEKVAEIQGHPWLHSLGMNE